MGGWAIAVHGGAGVDPNLPLERQEEAKRLLTRCLNLGISALQSSVPALDVVELVVRELETDPLFNSGRGSALTEKGTVEMEASIMDGPRRRCGAVSGLTTVKNPISLARLVMEKSPHSYLAFEGAEAFARQQGVETVDNEYFITEENEGMLKLAKEANTIMVYSCTLAHTLLKLRPPFWPDDEIRQPPAEISNAHVRFRLVKTAHGFILKDPDGTNKAFCFPQFDYRIPTDTCSGAAIESPLQMNGLPISFYSQETVGCVVVDGRGRCAAATSTGGLMNKMTGRIGDSPLIGAGTYACDLCAISCTGEGEAIIRGTLAREVAAVMEYKGLSLQDAIDYVIKERLDEGKAGLIAVSKDGKVGYGFNTTGMFRGCATEDGFMEVGIWE
ncbi:hypothetical protein ACLOJK_003874 [Asimina triloba]